MEACASSGTGIASPVSSKYLIVNADDFGQSLGVNRGIIEAYHRGIVTSASLMVRWPAAAEASAYAREHPSLSVGLHVDLGEQVFRAGEWLPLYTVVPLHEANAIRDEIARQLEVFHDLMGHGPSHLDSHQHVHLREPVRTILLEMAQQLGIPLRHCSPAICYCGSFYGQTAAGEPLPNAISIDGLIHILETLPAGCTELGCHPAERCDLDTMYSRERLEELRVLCDPITRATVAALGIELCSFASLPHGGQRWVDARSA